jgi:integrase
MACLEMTWHVMVLLCSQNLVVDILVDKAMKLTIAALRGLIKKPGRHSDGDGLYFRVLPGEKGYWVYRYRVAVEGKSRLREMSLGSWPEIGLAEARNKHVQLRAAVRGKGDPLAEKRAAKTAAKTVKAETPSFGRVADNYLDAHVASWRSSKHVYQWRMALGVRCGPIRDMPVNEVGTSDVLKVLTPLWRETPETASRTRGRIEQVLDAARALGHIDENRANPARWKGHLDKLLPKRQRLTRGHHAAMPYADLPAFMARLKTTPGVAALALRFTILTAARTNETLGMEWDEVAIDNGDGLELWRVPASRIKMQRPHSVPLSPAAVAILRRQLEDRRKGNPFVFPGPVDRKGAGRRPLSNMALAMLMRRMGEGEFTVHGMRAAFRSWAADTGVPFEVAEACLAHAPGNAVVQAYQRSQMVERRRPIMQAWADYLDGAVETGKVLDIAGRKRR